MPVSKEASQVSANPRKRQRQDRAKHTETKLQARAKPKSASPWKAKPLVPMRLLYLLLVLTFNISKICFIRCVLTSRCRLPTGAITEFSCCSEHFLGSQLKYKTLRTYNVCVYGEREPECCSACEQGSRVNGRGSTSFQGCHLPQESNHSKFSVLETGSTESIYIISDTKGG